jgi:hypothetical protein
MSHKWTANAFGTISTKAMDAARDAVRKYVWYISHDNLNIPLRVFSQRLHNQSHFLSASAATIWCLPEGVTLPSDCNRTYQMYRNTAMKERFDFEDVLYGDPAADDRMELQHIHCILSILINTPDFSNYTHRSDTTFSAPPPVHLLPSGSEHTIQQYILGTADIEEASYEGNDKVIEEWFRQLGMDSEAEKKKTGLERVIPWVGDQLTIERLRGLWKYRHEDDNSFDRMDYMIPVFGWFHLVMAFANSLHKQYLGTPAGIGGIHQAASLLKRKGLLTQSTQGPFWHHLDEVLWHIGEAHFRASWLAVGKVKSLSELKTKTPAELQSLAQTLYREHASREALVEMEALPDAKQDQLKHKYTMWNMDVLVYFELREAIKIGDVGRMEDLLPTLLFCFAGGGNSKYAIEVLELLQGLRKEWHPDIRYVVHWQFECDGRILTRFQKPYSKPLLANKYIWTARRVLPCRSRARTQYQENQGPHLPPTVNSR